MQAVSVTGLSRHYGTTRAVDDVSFEVASGEIFGIVGPDGAGKTTLMRLLAGIVTPTSGGAMVAGCDVVADPEAVKQRIGYLSQVFSLYRDLTIGENIDFVADLYSEDLVRAGEAKARMLAMTGLAPFVDRQAGRLSGGMKQKLGLMCALIHRPTVLLLDEPTTGVDPLSRRDFWRILADLPSQGVTIVLSSPYMDEASRCHRLALMDHGRVLAVGSAAELAARVSGQMVEVVTPDPRGALRVLEGLPGLLSATPFGDALHVRLDGDDAVARVSAVLAGAGVVFSEARPAEASLEDAFIDLVGRGETA
ncbi:MAG: ABC transporter ATP-binding protein [Armatimonadetes bacterium]|nr:ABC transporter ATP-binding protein [Armatimonadota bacterium]